MLRDASAMLKEIEDQLKSCSGKSPFKFTIIVKIPDTQNPDLSRNWQFLRSFGYMARMMFKMQESKFWSVTILKREDNSALGTD